MVTLHRQLGICTILFKSINIRYCEGVATRHKKHNPDARALVLSASQLRNVNVAQVVSLHLKVTTAILARALIREVDVLPAESLLLFIFTKNHYEETFLNNLPFLVIIS